MQHSLTLPPQAIQAAAATVLQHLFVTTKLFMYIYILKNTNYLHIIYMNGPIRKQIIYILSKKKISKGLITQMALCLQKKIVGHHLAVKQGLLWV